ncbi:Annexin A13, partial [Branchiostoma belcheri]
LNYYVREKEAERIAVNNELIKSRLLGVQPSYNLNKWEEDFLKHEYYLANMAAVTKDFDLDSLEPTPRDPPRRRRPRSVGTETRSVETGVLEHPSVLDVEDTPILTHDYYLVDNTEEPRDFYVEIIMQTKPLKKRTSILKNWAEQANVWSNLKTDRSTEAASTTDGEEAPKLPKIKLERSKGGGTWPPRRFHTKLPKVNRVDKNKTESQKELRRMEEDYLKEWDEQDVQTAVDLSQHDVDRDSRMLFKATKGLSQNEVSIVIKTLVRRTYRQRQETKAKFWELYDKELSEDLKSQLSDDFAPVINALLMEREKFDAMTVHSALKALEQIKKAYRDEHLNNLEDDIRSETSGQLQDLLLGLLAGDRDESNEIDEDLARQDAQELHQAGKDRWSTESDSKLMSLITTKSYSHIRATLTEYEKLVQTDMLDVLKDELSGEFLAAMVALVKVIFYCPKFFAERIYHAMRPRGDSATLIRCLMTRAEADMPLIRKAYKKAYGATIMDDLEGYVSAPYKPILVDLVRVPEGQDGNKKSQKRINGMVIHRAPPQLRPLRHQPIPPPKPVDIKNNPLAQPSHRPLAAAQREKSFDKTNDRGEGGRNGSDKENRDRGKGKTQRFQEDLIRRGPPAWKVAAWMMENRGLSLEVSLPSVEEVEEREENDSGRSDQGDGGEDLDGSEDTSTEEMPSRINSAPACLSTSYPSPDGSTCTKERDGKDEKEQGGQEELNSNDMDNEKETIACCILDEIIEKALEKMMEKLDKEEVRNLEEGKDNGGKEELENGTDEGKQKETDTESIVKTVEDEKDVEEDKDWKDEEKQETSILETVEEEKDVKDVNEEVDKEQNEKTVSERSTDSEEKEENGEAKDEDQLTQMPVKPTKKVTILESPIEVHVIVNQPEDSKEEEAEASVVPAKRFHVDRDCEDFRNAISGWATDEEPLIKLLSSRSHDQRQQVKKQYKAKYSKDILQDLKAEMGSSYDDLLVMLLTPRSDFDAWTMHKATQANDDNSKAVFAGILCTRSNKQIRAMRETYKKLFSRNLLDDLKACSTDRLADLLLALTKGDREERGKVDQSRAKEDAHELYEEDKLGANDRSRIVDILANRSVSGRELLETIEAEMPDDQKVGFAAIVRCLKDPAKFFAGRLKDAVSGSEGMDEDTLMRIVVTRSEVDLLEIKRMFKDQQGQALAEVVEDSCTGDHKKLLLALIKGNKGS